MNKCIFIGRTTRPVELLYTSSGKAYARFTLAVSDGVYKNQDGERVESVDFLDFTAWEKTAEFVAEYWGDKQGKPMVVDAKAKLEKWDGPDGEKRSKVSFKVNEVKFLPSNGKSNNDESDDDDDSTPAPPKKTTKKDEGKKAGFRPKAKRNEDDEDGITDGVI